jgi:hypothetical protein
LVASGCSCCTKWPAWIFTLPVTIAVAAGLFYVLSAHP